MLVRFLLYVTRVDVTCRIPYSIVNYLYISCGVSIASVEREREREREREKERES